MADGKMKREQKMIKGWSEHAFYVYLYVEKDSHARKTQIWDLGNPFSYD